MSVDTLEPETVQPPDSLKRTAARGGSLYLATRLGTQLFQWASTLYVARLLAPDDYGIMTTGTVIVGLADMLAEAGFGRALIHKRDLTEADQAQAFSLSLLLTGVLYALVWIAAGPIADHMGRPEFTLFLRVLALALWLVPIQAVAGALLERNLELGKQSAVHLLVSLVQTGLVLGLAVAGFGYWALGAGMLFGRMVQSVLVCYASGWRPSFALPGHEAWDLLKYGSHVSLSCLIWFIYSNADFAVLSALLGAAALGTYALAFQLISMPVQKISANINQVVFALFCKMRDDPTRVRDWFLRLVALQSFLAFPAMAGLALVAPDAIPLMLGSRWTDAVLPFQILCPIGAIMVVSCPIPPLLNALGRPDVNMKYTATCAALFLPGFLVAGWLWGVLGVCFAWLVIYPPIVAGLVHLTRHITGVTLARLLRIHAPILIGVALMSAAVFWTRVILKDDLVARRLVASISVGAVVYAGWILLSARGSILRDVRILLREIRG